MEYAHRYQELGYISAFFEGINCIHTGRLTSERFDESKLNAYSLNNQIQFGHENIKKETNCFVVNLDNRKDRWDNFEKIAPPFLSYERYSAVNGYKLAPTREMEILFNNCDYNFRKGMVGCALSHLDLWCKIAYMNQPIIILEDDITFSPNFKNMIGNIFDYSETFDVCFLGHHSIIVNKKESIDLSLIYKTSDESLQYSLGGTFGYIITPVGAQKLLTFIQKNGMTNGIDTMIQKAGDEIGLYYCDPPLVYSECIQHNYNADSDIQSNYESLARDEKKRFDSEIQWLTDNFIPYVIDITGDFSSVENISFTKLENVKCSDDFEYFQLGSWCIIIPKLFFDVYVILNKYREKCMKEDGKWNISAMIKYDEKVKVYVLTSNTPPDKYNQIDCEIDEIKSFKNFSFDLVICSPLKRALQTLKQSQISYTKTIVDANCREQILMPCDLLVDEIQTCNEDWNQIYERIEQFKSTLRELINSKEYKTILIISHNIFLRRLTCFNYEFNDEIIEIDINRFL